jgi:hypothetical protein
MNKKIILVITMVFLLTNMICYGKDSHLLEDIQKQLALQMNTTFDLDPNTPIDRGPNSSYYWLMNEPGKTSRLNWQLGANDHSKYCQDEDGGINPETFGIMNSNNQYFGQDFCFDNVTLVEYYCDFEHNTHGHPIKNMIVKCPNGCYKGVCKSEPGGESGPSTNGITGLKGSTVPSGAKCSYAYPPSASWSHIKKFNRVYVNGEIYAQNFCLTRSTLVSYGCYHGNITTNYITCPKGCSQPAGTCANTF